MVLTLVALTHCFSAELNIAAKQYIEKSFDARPGKGLANNANSSRIG